MRNKDLTFEVLDLQIKQALFPVSALLEHKGSYSGGDPKHFARFNSVNEVVLHRSVEFNILEDYQCLRFILLTVTEMSKYYGENHPVGCHSWENRFYTTRELPKQVLHTNILFMLFLLYFL